MSYSLPVHNGERLAEALREGPDQTGPGTDLREAHGTRTAFSACRSDLDVAVLSRRPCQ